MHRRPGPVEEEGDEMQSFDLPTDTHALRLVRCDERNNRFVYYEGVTFPGANTRATCDMYLRRASICGRIGEDAQSNYTIDVLNTNGDVVLELPAERKAARYLVEKLKIRVIRD